MGLTQYEKDLEAHLKDPDYRYEFITGLVELVRKDERDRIIALLEAKESRTDYRGNGPTFSMYEIIALIKGENNE